MTLTQCSVPSDPIIADFPWAIKVQCATIPPPTHTAKLEKSTFVKGDPETSSPVI